MTGAEFYLQLQQKYDKAYSQYLDTTKANRLIKEALYRLIDKLVSLMDTQKEYDEMSEMLKYDISLAVGGGVANQPNDYYHLMRMAFVFVDPITFTSISTTNVVSSDPFVRVGDIISTAADGSGTLRTVTKTTSTGFTVDSTFLPGVTNLYIVRNFEGSPSTSDKKKPSLSKPVKESPRYWTGVSGTDKVFFLQPVPAKVIVDYITQPPLTIDVVNNSTVLTTVYTQKFLYRLMDECVYSVATETRDYQNKQSATQTIIDNP
jgi:hypothetical protein